jgi:hypothetical protein
VSTQQPEKVDMSAVGGFSGGDALLAFAAIQQGRMNDEMTGAMKEADLRSQMASDLADIKSHLEIANRNKEGYIDVHHELQAFMDKYGDEPSLTEVTDTVRVIADDVDKRWANGNKPNSPLSGTDVGARAYAAETIKDWLDQIDGKLSASGTNDQLAMIHIKQLNDNINNSSGMVSGIIESRNNATSSIINNIA